MGTVWIVFNGVDDFYGPYFQGALTSKEAAESFIKEEVEREIKSWNFQVKNFEETFKHMAEGWMVEEHPLLG